MSSKPEDFIRINFNSSLLKIEQFWDIARNSKITVVGISESDLNKSTSVSKNSIDNYGVICCSGSKYGRGRGLSCNIRHDLSFKIKKITSKLKLKLYFQKFYYLTLN